MQAVAGELGAWHLENSNVYIIFATGFSSCVECNRVYAVTPPPQHMYTHVTCAGQY